MPRRYGEAPVASATVNPYSTQMGFPGSTSGKRICLAEQETYKTRSWRRKWQPTPVFLSEKFLGQRSLAGYSPWGCRKSDRTEHTHIALRTIFVLH